MIGDDKQRQWAEFAATVQRLQNEGRRGLRNLDDAGITRLIDDYQALTADLARARSLGAPRTVVDRLNRIAVAAHILLYSHLREARSERCGHWLGAFARAVRASGWAVALSAALLFGTAIIGYFAVQLDPQLGYDLVPDSFLEFDPARPDNLHHIPSLARPIASSAIMANNIQVTLLAFGLGLTAGLGTTWILAMNGLHIGAVAGWMTLHGKGRALWGWIMPHGGTELLAICLAGAAGYLLAGAIVVPGLLRRATALKRIGGRALVVEAGCMAMLLVAGAVEGFVSPSALSFSGRIVFLALSLAAWAAYFLVADRKADCGVGQERSRLR